MRTSQNSGKQDAEFLTAWAVENDTGGYRLKSFK